MHNVVSGWCGLSSIWLVVLVWRIVLIRLSGDSIWQGPGVLRTWIGALCVLLASGLLEAGVWSNLAPASDMDRVGRALLDALGYGGGIVAGLAGLGLGLPWLFGTRLSTLVSDLVGNTQGDTSPQPSYRRPPADRDARPVRTRSGRQRQQSEMAPELRTGSGMMDRPASSGLRAPGELGSSRRPGAFGSAAGQSANRSVSHTANRAANHTVNPGASQTANPVANPSVKPRAKQDAASTPSATIIRKTPATPSTPAAPARVTTSTGVEATARAAANAARHSASVASVPAVHTTTASTMPGTTAGLNDVPSARSLTETFRAVEEMASQWPALAGAARKPAMQPARREDDMPPAVPATTVAEARVETAPESEQVHAVDSATGMPPVSLAPHLPVHLPHPPDLSHSPGSPSYAEEAPLMSAQGGLEDVPSQAADVPHLSHLSHSPVSPSHTNEALPPPAQVRLEDMPSQEAAEVPHLPHLSHSPASPSHTEEALPMSAEGGLEDTPSQAAADVPRPPHLSHSPASPSYAEEVLSTSAEMVLEDVPPQDAVDVLAEPSISLTPHRPLLPPDDDIDLDDLSMPVVPSLTSPSVANTSVLTPALGRFAPPANEPLIPGFTVQRPSASPPPLAGHPVAEFEFHPPSASHVELPGLELLASAADLVEPASETHLAETGQLIEQRLKEFKVPVTVVGASAGPVITRFEVEPALGVRGAQIVGLMKDLSRGLGLTSIRVVETIPGKTCMGLELPNPKRQMIRLSEILASDAYRMSTSHLTIAMGKDITGTPVVTDLARAPHMLVAGTTGSGKSVAINAMIISLLYKAAPADVRLIMIDPKMLELSVYEGIPHLLAPVVTDMKLAANALNWCVGEMEKRYRLMSALGVRNIAGFNQKLRDAARAERKIGNPFSLTPDAPEPLAPLPLIVVVIDELADLMMVAGKKIEELIARLAQKARASGIHLILATQRPSVDVITGLIKANIPTRVAFQVSSKIDSRTILDQMGAESLLGQGDMLFLPPGSGDPQRIHGAFVADDEVHRVVEYLKQFGEPEYESAILDPGPGEGGAAADLFGDVPDPEADPLYDEAVSFVLRTRRASISSVQRQLRIGYNRAARLVEQMEVAGLVSAMGVNGSREVLAAGPSD